MDNYSNYLVIGLLLCSMAQNILANPEDGVVTAGQATIIQENNKLSINQQSDKVIIDWRTFNITATEHTHFNQPSSNAIALNRVNTDHASHINGQLTGNGKVIIINPNGVLFGKDAQINLAGLIATTSNIDNQKFMQDNKLVFDKPGNSSAKIINKGQINVTEGGLVGLFAPHVENKGIIVAKLGKVKLASGNVFTVDMYEDDLLKVEVSEELVSQVIANNGQVSADGGKILLTAAAGTSIINSIIANSGALQAQSVIKKNGEIIIIAEGSNAVNNNIAANKGQKSGNSQVFVAGVLDVSGLKEGERGGNIKVAGDQVAILNNTIINASGYSGKIGTTISKEKSAKREDSAGGEILIGGDYLGQGDFPTAKDLYVSPNVIVLNDAIYEGDAGRTIFWSDDSTHFYGNVFARALGGKEFDRISGYATPGGNAGDGGFVETSGHGYLDAGGYVDLTASNGKVGTYFLDPTDVAIYGNVTPKFVSTDGGINLNTTLGMWLDASDTNNVLLSYNSTGTTARGNSGTNTITVGSNTGLKPGARIQLGGTTHAYTAAVTQSTDGSSNVYTITNISGTTVTVTPNLAHDYSGVTLYQGYISQITDKSESSNHATQSTISIMPLWLSDAFNNLGTAYFYGGFLFRVPVTAMQNKNAFSYFLVYQNNTQSPLIAYAPMIIYGVDGTSCIAMEPMFSSGLPIFYAGGAYNYSQVPLDYNKHIFGVRWSKSAGNLYLDGGEKYNILNANLYIPNTVNYYTIGDYTVPNAGLRGIMPEIIQYNNFVSDSIHNLVAQYQATKWGIIVDPAVTNGNSIFISRYLENLANSSNISLSAANVKIDLQGDTITLPNDRNLTITASGAINSLSSGIISTNRTNSGGNINITSSGSDASDINNLTLNANNGGDVNIVSQGALTLGNINSGTILAQAAGASSDLTIAAGKTLTASGTGTPLTLVAGRNFINNAGSTALSLTGSSSPRWLIYSTNPDNNVGTAGLSSNFVLYNCTYGGDCPTLGAGNGLLYASYAIPKILTINSQPSSLNIYYGDPDPAPTITGSYTLSGYNNESDATNDVVTGSPLYGTNYIQGNSVGSYNIITSAGTLKSSLGYIFSSSTLNNAITVNPRPITITPDSKSKVYGDPDPSLTYKITSGTLYGSDILSGALMRVAGETLANSPYAINIGTLAPSNSSNYNVSLVPGATLTITQKTLTAALTGNVSKVYDGTDVATLTLSNYSLPGVVSGEDVSLNYPTSGLYDTKAFGTGKTVTVTGLTMRGANINNYILAKDNASGQIGEITKKPLTVSLIGKVSKEYDRTLTVNNLTSDNYSLSGVISGDTVTLNHPTTGSYYTKLAKTAKTVTVTGLTISGADANNYTLASSVSGIIGEISKKSLTANLIGKISKEYDKTSTVNNLAPSNYNLSGVINGDTVVLNSSTTGSYDTEMVGENKIVTVTGLTISGADVDNYILTDNASGQIGEITKKPLTVSLIGKVSKEYDRTLTVNNLTSDNYSLSGVVSGDTITLNHPTTGSYYTKSAKTAKTVTVTGLTISGANADYYNLASSASGVIGEITPKPLTANLIGKVSKKHDGTDIVNNLTVNNYSLPGVINEDTVILNNPITGSYDNEIVGENKTVTVTGLTIIGADAGNYNLTDHASGPIGEIEI